MIIFALKIITCNTHCAVMSSRLSIPSEAEASISAQSLAEVANNCSGAICFSKETYICILFERDVASLPLSEKFWTLVLDFALCPECV